MRTLVLDQGYQPHRIISWQRAICMMFDGKVEVVQSYDEVVCSPSVSVAMPAVVRLHRSLYGRKRAIKFSRINVAMRDDFRCQYCATQLPLRHLTFDHVVPKARGGATSWHNIVMACYDCNERKGGRTPAEANMPLCKTPAKPTWLPAVAFRIDARLATVPPLWVMWLPRVSEARGSSIDAVATATNAA